MSALQAVALLAVAATGTATVLAREPLRQAGVSGVFGLALAAALLTLQAPDVALSQVTIGGVVLPVIILLALAKIREHE